LNGISTVLTVHTRVEEERRRRRREKLKKKIKKKEGIDENTYCYFYVKITKYKIQK
jgi:hypothetical protein